MSKLERIEELEREVAELKARPAVQYVFPTAPTYVYPWWGVIPPHYGRCAGCGGALTQGHVCYPFISVPSVWIGTATVGGTTTVCESGNDIHFVGALQ